MAEFLVNRRYCRFRDRKNRRSKMNGDNAVDFKMKRFIHDVDKQLEKAKKKEELKELKRKEDNFTGKRGFYKSAVVSHTGLKATLTESTNARLKGDLIGLSKKQKSSKKKGASEILSQEGEKPRVTSSPQKRVEENYSTFSCVDFMGISKSPQILPFNGNEVFDDITELKPLSVENKTPEQITQAACAQDESIPIKRCNQVIQENLNPGGFFSEVENPFREIAVTDVFQNTLQNETIKQIFDEEPSNTVGEFFDLLSNTIGNWPEKTNSSSFQSFIELVNSPKPFWDTVPKQYQQNFKVSSPEIRHPEISRTQPILPKDYTFKFNTQKNESSNKFDLFKENNMEEKKFDLSLEYFKSDIGSPKFKHSFVKSCFSSNNLPPTKLLDISGPDHQSIERISSVTKIWAGNSSNFRKGNPFFNRRAKTKTSIPFSGHIRNCGGNEESIFMIPKLKKHFEKNQFYPRKKIKNKKEQLVNKNNLLLCSNNRYKTSLKFSPHRYC